MSENMKLISTDEELKVFNDPYRMKIIKTFQQSKTPLTVKGCADIMGEVPANVYYHVQKLIKIGILALHHQEIINGITAKYYHLPFKNFLISIKENDETQKLKQLTQVHRIISRLIDDFKDNFMKASALANEKKLVDDSDIGLITSNEIYLTEEEFNQMRDYFATILKNQQMLEADPDKKKYLFLGGLAKMDD